MLRIPTAASVPLNARRRPTLPGHLRLCVLLSVLALFFPHTVAAQAGVTTDILAGQVLGPGGEPVANARVEVISVQTAVRRSTLTNPRGRYNIFFTDGFGVYEVVVSSPGLQTVYLAVVRRGDEPVLFNDIRMEVSPIRMEGITVEGEVQRAGETAEGAMEGEWLSLLPLDPTDLAAVAQLEPGVVGLEVSDSIGSGGFSILGLRPDLNQVVLDGASFGSPRGGEEGGLGIPAEAVRLTRVVTNSYDVSRGQFSGGQISSTTRGGTNRLEGSVTYSLFEPRLQYHPDGSASYRAYTQHRMSGGVGGPIIEDRLFYFASGAIRHRSQARGSLLEADLAALEFLGVHPDSVGRFVDILQTKDISADEPASASQMVDEVSLFGRVDLVLSDRHSVMVRGDARWNFQEGTRISTLGLPHSGGFNEGAGGGAMVALTSQFGEATLNEFRAYFSVDRSDADPFLPIPEGRVRVASELEDGTRSVSNLVFGGNRSLPVTSQDRTLEITNELSRPLGDRHRLRVGALLNLNRSAQEFSPTQYGSFSFNSLEDFANDAARAYSRSLAAATRQGGGLNAALYIGDTWQWTQELQVTYGLRGEASAFGQRPDFNPAVEEAFGRRTDQFPGELRLSPRLGFTYQVGESPRRGRPLWTVRGGVGEFRGKPPFSLFSTALDATGLPGGQVQISCVGERVPSPVWLLYQQDRGAIPLECADGETPEAGSGRAPNVTAFNPAFHAPRSWRASAAVERQVGQALQLSLEATYNLGTRLYGVTDLNLRMEPGFRVPLEDSRPVFVDPADIVPGSGRVNMMDARTHGAFGQVLEVHSEHRSHSGQLSLGARVDLPTLSVRSSYTFTRARDESSFSCCSAGQGFASPTTAGDPNDPGWATSTFERRHALAVTAGWQFRPWGQLTTQARATSGAPFTPLVGGDINGDGARNDRAFIVDPSVTSDLDFAASMRRLLEEAPGRIRRCLQEQMGKVAARNSCRGPWYSTLEIRANLSPELPRVGKRVTASLASRNLLTGLDQVLHGAAESRGWGQRNNPDAVLLYPRSFDLETLTFGYEVNERFGSPRQGSTPFGTPFEFQMEVRVAVGHMRRR